MWITGKIPIARYLSNEEILERLPRNEAEIENNQVVIKTNRIPFFAEHKLLLFIHEGFLHYKLGIPAMWPLVIFLYLSVFFLAGMKQLTFMLVGSMIVTGIFFAIYVTNDKGARAYIYRHLQDIIADEFSPSESPKKAICPQCGFKLDKNSNSCKQCGFKKSNSKAQPPHNHTGQKNTDIIYHIK